MAFRVVLPSLDDEEPFARFLRSQLEPSIELMTDADTAPIDALVDGRPDRETLQRLRPLRVIIPYSGVPPKTLELLADFPETALHNIHHNAAPTAESTVALLLAAAKRLIPADRALRTGDWSPRYDMEASILLEGRTAVIVGYGAIGRRVGDVCRALGMQVEAVARRARPAEDVHGEDALQALLPRADALILTLPASDATRGMIGAAELARLPARALLVNVARGPVIDEDALYAAAFEGRLGAAGLDVWYQYPASEDERESTQPSRHPFGELDNIVLSPHRAGHCDRTPELRASHVAQLLNAAARGDEVPGLVDRSRGY